MDLPALSRPLARPAQSTLVGLALASLLACSALPLMSRSAYGDLSGVYTDHLRHAHLTWLFLHEGLAIYREPYGAVAARVPYRHSVVDHWPHVPYAYPPLALALYAPYAIAGQYLPLSQQAFGQLGILYLLVLSHLSLLALWRALGPLSWASAAAGALTWMLIVRSALQGFYDPLWLLFGALAVERLRRRDAAAALPFFALAALSSYRAVALAPLALGATWLAVRGRPVRAWPWRGLAFGVAAALVCVLLFLPVLPYSQGFREEPHLLARGGPPLLRVAVVSAVAVPFTLFLADAWVAAAVALVTGLALVDTSQWWHGLVLLSPILGVGALVPARHPRLATAVLILWALVLHRQVWGGSPDILVSEVRWMLANR